MGLNWDTLIDNVKAGVCIPFLGAGACYGVLPTGKELAEELLGGPEAADHFPFPDARANLAKVTQFLAAIGGDAQSTKRRAASAIKARGDKAVAAKALPRIHRILARMKLPIYLTTNYDTMLETALGEVPQCAPRTEICRWSRALLEDEQSCFDTGDFADDPARPVVFHLHGRVDRPESLVVTEDDYLDFLLNVSRDVSGSPSIKETRTVLPLPLRSRIKRRPLLFVGYSLSDVNFLVILRGLLRSVEPSDRVQRVAVYLDPRDVPADANPAQLRERIEHYFEWTLDVDVFWGNADQLADKLAASLGIPP